METTRNELSPYASNFFNRLKNYINEKIYFYGSVQRYDYFSESDIDVDVFTENMSSTIVKIQHFLNVKRNEFKKIIYKLNTSKKIVYGYKIKYDEPEHNFFTEISIYPEKNKEDVLTEHNFKQNLPFYILFLLIILKYLYYNIQIIPNNIYIKSKRFILDLINKDNETSEQNFILL